MRTYINKTLVIGVLFFVSFTSFGLEKSDEKPTSSAEVKEQQQLKDCSFTIKGNYDGLEVDVEITVYDISWVECAALQLTVKALQ
ncbi:MAG: hypothetical protein ACJAT1_001984 [Marivirga sp.]|jgi:hypothetical protein